MNPIEVNTLPPFSYAISTNLVFGNGTVASLPAKLTELGFGRRIFLVTDPGLLDAGIPERLKSVLDGAGFSTTLFSQVRPNPRDSDCMAGAQEFAAKRCDAIVAVGGGSAMDTAKTIALLARQGGTPSAYADGLRSYGETAPVACIPTTAGTGSEVTRSAVITEADTHRKMTLKHEWLRPAFALLDPELTVTVPPSVTAATGVDALVHAIEGYSCTKSQPISRAFGAQALGLIYRALPRAYSTPDDLDARSDMLLGSLLAGLCFGSADVAAVHCLAEALGGLYDTPHGIANAVFLLPVLRYNVVGHEAIHAEIARHMGVAAQADSDGDAVQRLLDEIEQWLAQLDIPPITRLNGVNRADDDRIVELAMANGSTSSNVRPLTAEAYRAILDDAYESAQEGRDIG